MWFIGMHSVLFFFLFREFYKQTYQKKRKSSVAKAAIQKVCWEGCSRMTTLKLMCVEMELLVWINCILKIKISWDDCRTVDRCCLMGWPWDCYILPLSLTFVCVCVCVCVCVRVHACPKAFLLVLLSRWHICDLMSWPRGVVEVLGPPEQCLSDCPFHHGDWERWPPYLTEHRHMWETEWLSGPCSLL